jgi:hypothetical protein
MAHNWRLSVDAQMPTPNPDFKHSRWVGSPAIADEQMSPDDAEPDMISPQLTIKCRSEPYPAHN